MNRLAAFLRDVADWIDPGPPRPVTVRHEIRITHTTVPPAVDVDGIERWLQTGSES